MDVAVLPTDERGRLQALVNLRLLDTPAEERFDRITRLAAAHFSEPYAAVNLIDADRQWSKSCVGCRKAELPRDLSFCAHAILHNRLMVVEDLSADPRFCDHPLVIGGARLRFYAGAPVHSSDGYLVGTICVYGMQPHSLTEEARQDLCDFAGLVDRELSATEVEVALRESRRHQDRFQAAAEANLDCFIILEGLRDPQGKITDFVVSYANSRFEQIVAMPRDQVLGRRLRELMPLNYIGDFFDKYVRVVETGVPIEEEFAVSEPSLRPTWILHQVVPLGDGVAITSRDVSARRAAEEEATRTNARLRKVVRSLERRTRDIMLLNELGELLLSSRTISEVGDVVALSLLSLLPRTMGVLYLEDVPTHSLTIAATWGGYPADSALARESCWALRRQRVHYVSVGREKLFCQHSSATNRCESLCVPLRSQGRIFGLLHVLSLQFDGQFTTLDEAPRQLAMTVAEWTSLALANLMLQSELRQQALRDPLTGLYNRRYFEDLVPKILADAARDDQPVSVIAVDIDRFKLINDRHGHATGDRVLQVLARLLQTRAGGEALACRFGGEEFVLVLPQCALAAAADWAEELRGQASRAHRGVVPPVPEITISLGVAAFPQHGEATGQLLAAADAALYRAKAGGRDRVELAED